MRADLPPEAFTKKNLQEAFQWLQTQPEAMRETVHTPERLVSLYRQAKRTEMNDAPVSSKLFVDDLKNLASSLDEFSSDPQPSKITTPQAPAPKPPTPPVMPSLNTAPEQVQEIDLDLESRQKLTKVRKRFNLSSDSEALRLLISLGFEKYSDF